MDITKAASLKGELTVPGDKSISHRSIILGALAHGTTEASHFLMSDDCISTINCFRNMGIDIEVSKDTVRVQGKGLNGLSAPSQILDCGNSGTAIRLLSGILTGQKFASVISGDDSIQKRPMKRIMEPLKQMGADISSVRANGCAPLAIAGLEGEGLNHLKGIHYHTPMASAQVKSAILLAGLYADGPTSVTEPSLSRNHTELMLKSFGADLFTQDKTSTVQPRPHLSAQKIQVPGDISSAAYFIAAAALVPHSEVLLKQVGINPTRSGIISVLKEMGADITFVNRRIVNEEEVTDLLVRSSSLKAVTIEGDIIPTLIDEIPVIAVLAAMAEGTTVIKDAAELKVKESDRLLVVYQNLTAMGAEIVMTEDGLIIPGGQQLRGATIPCYNDHRIAMSFAVAGLIAQGTTKIPDSQCIQISYPQFFSDLDRLTVKN